MSKRTVIELPKGWSLSHLTVHYEKEDFRDDPNPFAANVVAQLRFDVGPNADLEEVVADDVEAARASSERFELVSKNVRNDSAEVEWISAAGGHALRQMTIYRNIGGSIYSVVGTHREERFDNVRRDIMAIAGALMRTDR